MEYIANYMSPLGGITLAGEREVLTGLWFDGQKHFARTLSGGSVPGKLPVLDQAIAWLEAYFAGDVPGFTPPLRPKGTPFQAVVWQALLTIPYGQTRTYGQLAAQIAQARGMPCLSAQAVGGAVGCNPISLIIPCHRVIRADGSLTGYAGGMDKKAWLLALESRRG